MEEVEIRADSPWVHKRVSEIENGLSGRMLIVAILRKEGATDLNPSPSAMLMPGDALVLIKRVLRR